MVASRPTVSSVRQPVRNLTSPSPLEQQRVYGRRHQRHSAMEGDPHDRCPCQRMVGHSDIAHIPRYNILLIGVVSLIGSFRVSYQLGAELLNFGAFIGFMGVKAAAFLHYWVRAERKRLTHLLPPVLGFLICLGLWLSLLPVAKIFGVCWLLLGLASGAWRTRGFRHLIRFEAPSD